MVRPVNKQWRITLLAAAAALALTSCGGSRFAPQSGPYSGTLLVSGAAKGTISFTIFNGELGGTGELVVGEAPITVSLAANINGKGISGTIANDAQGDGSFAGSFQNGSTCVGSFTFVTTDGLTEIEGTWVAST